MVWNAFIVLAALLLLPLPASALDSQSRSHAKSAFQLARDDRWQDAQAHAALSGAPLLKKIIHWMYCKSPNSDASFDEISKFMYANPDWPDLRTLQLRAEQALLREEAPSSITLPWLKENPPISGAGKITLALAMRENGEVAETIAALVRDGWRGGDFDEASEERILSEFDSLLREPDHAARIDRLLWEEKFTAAERVLPHLNADDAALARTRMALARKESGAIDQIAELSTKARKDAGILFEQLRWYARRDRHEKVIELLLAAPAKVPYPEKWWEIREEYVREAIGLKEYQQAAKLLNNHAQEEGKPRGDALWLKGWITLEFLRDPKKAYHEFYALYNDMKFPGSKARAAYWAARAAAKNGNEDIARGWLKEAAAFPTTFYGQLAAAKVGSSLEFPAVFRASRTELQRFNRRELTQATRLMAELGVDDIASKFILHMVDSARNPRDAALAAALGREIGEVQNGVRAAKRALQNNVVLIEAGYPMLSIPRGLPVEKPLTLAVMRQESNFDPQAQSPANALGLMQLLPDTAQEVAGKIGSGFSRGRLYEPDYNITLGSHYLGSLLNRFNGSDLAAYNAGPGRVRGWVTERGTPGNSEEQVINWIESIPNRETRNYVQHVLENLQVYRRLVAPGKQQKTIDHDLVR